MNTPVIRAVEASAFDALKCLVLEWKADLALCQDSITRSNAFHLVAFTGDDAIARWMLEHLVKHQPHCIEILLACRNEDGKTPWDVAEIQEQPRVALEFNRFLFLATGSTRMNKSEVWIEVEGHLRADLRGSCNTCCAIC